MKRQILTALLLAAVPITTIAGALYAQQSSQIPGNAERILGNANNLPLVENPEPRLKKNKDLPDSQLIPIEKINGNTSKLPKGAKRVKVEKKLFGDFEKKHGGGRFHDVDVERQVYEVVTTYPELSAPRAGVLRNATETIVLDAETGELIFQELRGEQVSPPRRMRINGVSGPGAAFNTNSSPAR